MRPFLFLLMIALFTGIAAKAQADPDITPKFRGYWAAPDCGRSTAALILTKYFYIKSTENDSMFSPALFEKRGDYALLTVLGAPHPVLRTEDSILKIGIMDPQAPEALPEAWDSLPLSGRNEYTGCPEAPEIVPAPLVRVMERIDEIRDACGRDITPACKKLLFSILDSPAAHA